MLNILNSKKFWRVIWCLVVIKAVINITSFYSQAAVDPRAYEMVEAITDPMDVLPDTDDTNGIVKVYIKDDTDGYGIFRAYISVDGLPTYIGYAENDDIDGVLKKVHEPVKCGVLLKEME